MKTHSNVEYGVIIDRTARGLGYYLHSTHRDREKADFVAARFDPPAAVQSRTVIYTEWAEPERTP